MIVKSLAPTSVTGWAPGLNPQPPPSRSPRGGRALLARQELVCSDPFVSCFSQEIKQKQKAQDELSSRPQALPLPDVVPDGDTHHGQHGLQLLNGHAPGAGPHLAGFQQANRHHGLLGGALANLFVIVGFAAFAYTVKYVLRSIAQE